MDQSDSADTVKPGKEHSYSIAIKCPNAGMPTPVGTGTTKQAFETSSFSNNSFSCGVCGHTHKWDKHESFLVVQRGQYRGEQFIDEIVVLDGNSFNDCKFKNCETNRK